VDATTPHLLLDAYVVLHLQDHAAALPIVRRALDSLIGVEVAAEDALSNLETGCWVAGAIADDEALHALSARLVDLARSRGALVHLSSGLLYLAMSQLLRGSLPSARARFAERSELLSAMGVDRGDVGRVVVSAWSGPADEVRADIAKIRDLAAESRRGWMLVFLEYAHAVLELGLGNYEAAAAGVAREFEDDSFLGVVGFPNTVEALARSGRLDEARTALDVFAARTEASATNLSLGLLARTRAILADDADVDELCRESIARLERSGADLQLGRAHLLYGEWLRRQKRRAEARIQLRTAYELFADRGVGPFAERARIELEATGERARARTVDTARDLTPQERQVALLASESLTNAEIASKLYLSSSTVDYHLRKVYRKLGIDSRRQLQHALAQTQ
jgi:DNA-binding CsgD family transcriptional regulator